MLAFISALLSVFISMSAPPLQAQESPLYVVTYIEAAPAASATAASILRQFADAMSKEPGNVRFELLQRLERPNQFATVAVWKDRGAYDAYAAAPGTKTFAGSIKPHLISAMDERLHSGLNTDGTVARSASGAVHVVTHVDVPPPSKDDCISLLKALAEDSRKEPGAARFEVFQQSSRPNHFSVVEIWKDQSAYEGHITAAHTKRFREQLTPMSGALYDERLFKNL